MVVEAGVVRSGRDVLIEWMGLPDQARSERQSVCAAGGVRFAFYGRTSTSEHQDPVTSAAWQRESAEELTAGHGTIVAHYFDVGKSRSVPWRDRPEAAALLRALRDPDRGFDAIVVGEYERAFAGEELARLLPLFRRYGVRVWLPEAAGPVDPDTPEHKALMTILAARSLHEIRRAKYRARAAMTVQTRDQGRYLGGRAPYGYRFVDAGPHPIPSHAQAGRRLRRLEPDPVAAPHVRWMFAQRLGGVSLESIVAALNDKKVPCPAEHDADRNRHRIRGLWTVQTVATILNNPRYTGWQVWGRQTAERDNTTPTERRRGRPGRRTAAKKNWVLSNAPAHAALVGEHAFVSVQRLRTARPTQDGTTRTYRLAGDLRCRPCGRRMDSHWAHGRPGYRCRHQGDHPEQRRGEAAKTLYVREDELLTRLAELLHPDEDRPARSPHELVAELRAHGQVIVYDIDQLTLAARHPAPEAVETTNPTETL
ncbi:recombinase family protein [Saccharothrix sp. Mg75]|uniref:recombinase family protein n=1 Tax=Saccharothrix sp. Mg75 TaxID=3445357 RepID=UPI003EED3DDB